MTEESQLRQQICEIGHRMWLRDFCGGNAGNISVRIGPDQVLCTPANVSKGFMKDQDLCKVDLTGRQLDGPVPSTSEILLHLEIYKARPDVMAVLHAHPPHLTAFAVARRAIPMGILAEMEVLIGPIPLTQYATPGTQELARSVLPFVNDANTVLLANHGAVTWGKGLEQTYLQMETAEGYCRVLILAEQIGGAAQLSQDAMDDLLKLKKDLGITNHPRPKG